MHTWTQALAAEKQQPYFRHILDTVRAERAAGQTIYPPAADVFNAFKATEFSAVKAVILGQDPYHGAGQAHGLAFSVRPNVPVPPSLQNIYKELADDLPGFAIPTQGCLQHWAEQGVLLLNTVLTVRAGQAHSHAALGWETFTDTVIRHLVLTSPPPSPLSAYRGFFGSRPFSQTNAYLAAHGQTPIDWQI